MNEERPPDGYGDLFGVAACLGVLCGNLVWIVPALISGGWEAIGILPVAAIVGALVGALVGLILAGFARAAIAIVGDRLPKAPVAGTAVALIVAGVVLVSTGGVRDPLWAGVSVLGSGALAATAVALRRHLRRATTMLLASTLVLSVSVAVIASVSPARTSTADAAAWDATSSGGSVAGPTPVTTPRNGRSETDARRRALDIRSAAGEVRWLAEPAIVGYPCAGSDGLLGSAVSYSFSGSFRTDPASLATDPPSPADVAAVERISAALDAAGFAGRPFASGTASTEFVGGDPGAPEQLLIAHGGAVTSVTYVGACVDGDES